MKRKTEQDGNATTAKNPDEVDQATRDAVDLAAMGHSQALSRKFNLWSMLALACGTLGMWSTEAQDLASGLQNGGPIAILWGLLVVTLCSICVAVSMGELCSSMPTALGQAFWISHLWPTPTGRFLSYICAWINTFGWWTLAASQNAFMTNFLLGMKLMFDEDWAGDVGWVQFVIYVGITIVSTIINHVTCRSDKILPWFNNLSGILYIALFFAISLALLASIAMNDHLQFQSAKFVFATWINESGWPDGVTWFMGLVQGAYGLTAFDSVIHMVEEMPAPRRDGPKVIYMSVICGAVSGFIFMVVCLFSIQDVDKVLNPPTGQPFMELLRETVGLAGAGALLALFICNGIALGISSMTSSSRLTWSFARDGGIPFSAYFTHVDPTWKVPGRALWLQAFLISLVGVLYLFASTVLQAILSVTTVALTISYAILIIVLLIVGRDKLPPGEFRLGRFGTAVNIISIIYCFITSISFLFPSSPDPAPIDMNYAIAVFGVMLVIAVGFWFVKGRVSYMRVVELEDQVLYEKAPKKSRQKTNSSGEIELRDNEPGDHILSTSLVLPGT